MRTLGAGADVTGDVIFFLATLLVSVLLDAMVRPRPAPFRQLRGLAVHLLTMTAWFGLGLAGSGSAPIAAMVSLAFMALLTVASNAKLTMLGEPLVFSDLARLAAVVRHPRFYVTAIPLRQRWLAVIAAGLVVLTLIVLFNAEVQPHLLGLAMLTGALGGLIVLMHSRWFASIARTPALEQDLRRFGLVATLLFYWLRWRETAHPPPRQSRTAPDAADAPPELIVIVQCESFADPVALMGAGGFALPGLHAARSAAWQYGELDVSGFGAYTMRTEYGVLFGRDEDALGFRRYDPFLTAQGEASHALSAQLKSAGYDCSFVHPYDLRFYGRNRLMPAIGFDRMVGAADLPAALGGGKRYVDDRTLGLALQALIDRNTAASFFYAVTMENHGPWDQDRQPGAATALEAYLLHLQSSDAMLGALSAHLAADGRPSLLVFFGDHRPSIPGAIEPGAARHTPYVMVRFDGAGNPVPGDGRVDLSPAGLQHAVLQCLWPQAEQQPVA